MTLYTHAASNIRKTWLLLTGFFIFVIALGWVFAQVYGSPLILWFAVILSILMSFFSYWYSDKMVVAISRAKPVAKPDAPELYRLVENISITAGLPMPKVYIVDDPAPNAFATGRNPKHAVVAVTTGILERLEKTELEGVLAHELSHIGNRDMLVSSVAVVLAGTIAILSDMLLRSMFWGGPPAGGGRDRDRGGGAALLIIGIAAAILAPLAATFIRLAISRKREFLADASGALLTRYPDGLARALEKISQFPQPMRRASTATAHLWLEDPFKQDTAEGKRRAPWFVKLFMTHPPIEERVRALRGMSV